MSKYVAFMTEWLGLDVTACLKDMKNYEKDVRACYYEECHMRLTDNSRDFVQSLLVVGCKLCFILFSLQKMKNPNDVFSEMDTARTVYHQLSSAIVKEPTRAKLDMLNPANQIPLFVLKTLFIKSNLRWLFGNHGISSLVMSAMGDLYPRGDEYLESYDQEHVLQLFYTSRVGESIREDYVPKRIEEFYIPNARELLGSATVFKTLHEGPCEVNFSKKLISAEMHITPMHIFSYTRELYTHLLNYEWGCRRLGTNNLRVTNFLAIMRNLLQTTKDVKLLQKKGIVKHTLPGEEDVLICVRDIWKGFGQEEIVGIPSKLDELSKEVMKHHESRFTVAYAGLKRRCCPNWCVAISIFAALTLFGLTSIQTMYTILGYYKI